MKKIIVLGFLVISVFLFATQMIVHTSEGEVSFNIGDIEQITFSECTINITNPNSETIWYQPEDFWIEWENAEGSQAKFDLYQNGEFISLCHDWTNNDGICHGWLSESWGTGDVYQVYATDTEGNCGWSEEFSIESNGSIVVTNPNSETIWYQGDSFTVEWSNAEGSQVLVEIYQYGVYIGICHNWTANDGQCNGQVQEEWGVGDYFKVKVIEENEIYGWSEYFSISE